VDARDISHRPANGTPLSSPHLQRGPSMEEITGNTSVAEIVSNLSPNHSRDRVARRGRTTAGHSFEPL
jgi:hypothetical protein